MTLLISIFEHELSGNIDGGLIFSRISIELSFSINL